MKILSVIPNLITAMRFVLVIPISVSIYQGNYFMALVLLFPPSQFLRRTEKIGLKEEIHKG